MTVDGPRLQYSKPLGDGKLNAAVGFNFGRAAPLGCRSTLEILGGREALFFFVLKLSTFLYELVVRKLMAYYSKKRVINRRLF